MPRITSLSPALAKRGITVTLIGSGFGAARGSGTVKFGDRTCTAYVSWSDTRVKCKVPANARYGAVSVTVTTAVGTSNAKGFTVKR
jgi:hypothetical protein